MCLVQAVGLCAKCECAQWQSRDVERLSESEEASTMGDAPLDIHDPTAFAPACTLTVSDYTANPRRQDKPTPRCLRVAPSPCSACPIEAIDLQRCFVNMRPMRRNTSIRLLRYYNNYSFTCDHILLLC